MHVEQHGEYSSAAAAYHIPGRRPLSMSAASPYVLGGVVFIKNSLGFLRTFAQLAPTLSACMDFPGCITRTVAIHSS